MIACGKYFETDLTGREPQCDDPKGHITTRPIDIEDFSRGTEVSQAASVFSRTHSLSSPSIDADSRPSGEWPTVHSSREESRVGTHGNSARSFKSTQLEVENEVLDTFRGKIVSIRGSKAFVTLEAADGTLFRGTRNADDFLKQGMDAGDAFLCETVRNPHGVEVRTSPLQLKELTDAQIDAKASELTALFDDEVD